MAEEPTRAAPLRVTVYGSCVARDTIDLAGGQDVKVVDYVARQSLLSSGLDASAHFPEDAEVAHRFQRRMLEADFRGDLEDRLRRSASATDVLLWDLTDERHGVHSLDDGTIITRSIDLLAVPEALAAIEDAELLTFGSDEHFDAWSQRARAFQAVLTKLGLFEKTLVIRLPWASESYSGEPTPLSMGVSAEEANAKFERYYVLLEGLGFELIEIDEGSVVADPRHRWGFAPFHYTQSVYDQIMKQVLANVLHG